YYDNKVIRNQNTLGRQFYVENSIDSYDWKITKESNEIDGYICYRAYTEILYNDIRGKGSYTLEAWFCPDFPFKYGPDRYFGLPGLVFIAGKKGGTESFVLEKIEKLNSIPNLKIPKIENTITEEEYIEK